VATLRDGQGALLSIIAEVHVIKRCSYVIPLASAGAARGRSRHRAGLFPGQANAECPGLGGGQHVPTA
jgi:hypothetical protein